MAQELLSSVQKNVGDAYGTLFRKNMTDLVRGIRANKDNEAKYISGAMAEIKEELASQDKDEKANAVQKLTYVLFLPFLRSSCNLIIFCCFTGLESLVHCCEGFQVMFPTLRLALRPLSHLFIMLLLYFVKSLQSLLMWPRWTPVNLSHCSILPSTFPFLPPLANASLPTISSKCTATTWAGLPSA
jgi:hypothetical protein